MNYILFIVCFNILSLFSANPIKPKLCVDCKFFTKDFFTSNKFGKCSLFPYREYNDSFLVDGIKENKNIEYHYCSTSRMYDNMCGEKGKLFENKNVKKA
jgi:hypothetical protein